MSDAKTALVLTEQNKKQIFSELLNAQDHNMSVPQSRKFITKRFHIREDQIRQIEKEGMALHWPPL